MATLNSKKGYKHRIKLSENMLKQGNGLFDNLPFDAYRKAYLFVCEKWGSAVLSTPSGLEIQMAKIGTEDWEDCR